MTEAERLDGIIDSMDMSLSRLWGMVKDREAWCAAVNEVAKTELNWSLGHISQANASPRARC